MIVVPAIDVRAGHVVRLKQGRLQDEEIYGSDPSEAARRFEAEGARRIHLVDLDAALQGRPQPEVVEAVLRAVSIPIEVGGGLRTLETAQRYRDRGADRLIFGTAVVSDPQVVQGALALFGEAVVVALDARNGLVTVGGWQETTQVRAVDLAVQVGSWGVRRVQYTDVVRDGMLSGPNLAGIAELIHVSGLRVTAAGGISTLADLLRVRDSSPLVDEAVVGKALYEGRFTLTEARNMLED
jgi:phosphoribosylformimino-5-aminoimidazole carboxamide ribotide isomerase